MNSELVCPTPTLKFRYFDLCTPQSKSGISELAIPTILLFHGQEGLHILFDIHGVVLLTQSVRFDELS